MKRFFLRWGLALVLLVVIPVSILVVCTPVDPPWFLPSYRQNEQPIPEGTRRDPYMEGGYRPVLQANGKRYHWDTVHTQVYNTLGQDLHRALKDKASYLPEGFAQAGSFTWVGDDAPTADLQLQAGFETSGIVYLCSDFPEVAYIRLKAHWFDRGEEYVRFVTEELGSRICWQGRQYRCTFVDRDRVDSLPEGCTSIGLLQFVTRDGIPTEDLHTNSPALARHEVFADGQKLHVLYVADTWGEHRQWYRCRLWEDWTE